MGIGSGLGAQLGIGDEASYGAIQTPTRFPEFDSETLALKPTYAQGRGLRAGQEFLRGARSVLTTREAGGDVTVQFANTKMGLIVARSMGSTATPVQISSTTAYRQSHIPGPLAGHSLTVQVGRPQTDGTVKPFTYRGCKVTAWELDIKQGQIITFKPTFDAQDETTATSLAVASYVAKAPMFVASQESAMTLGGTPSTTGSVTSVAGGVAVTSVVRGFSLKCANPMKTDRFGLNFTKAEPISNDFRQYSGTVDVEFNTQAEFYDLFATGALTTLQLTVTGAAIGVSGNNDTLDIIIPQLRWTSAAPNVSGPDIIVATMAFDVKWNEADAPVQVTLISADTTI